MLFSPRWIYCSFSQLYAAGLSELSRPETKVQAGTSIKLQWESVDIQILSNLRKIVKVYKTSGAENN